MPPSPSFVPYFALALSVLSAVVGVGAGVGAWLITDAREKTRSQLTQQIVSELTKAERGTRDELIELRTKLEHLGELVQTKADRQAYESLREFMQRIDSHLDKIDDKIEDIRAADRR